MKKTTTYKMNIARAWVAAIVTYIIFLTIIVIGIIHFVPNEDIGLQWIIMSPVFAFLFACPMFMRAENIENHFKHLLKKEKEKAL